MASNRGNGQQTETMRWQSLFAPEWVFRYLALALLVANLWLNSHFIAKEEYSADKQAWTQSLTKLNDAVVDLKFSLAANVEQRAIINDHESRIRSIEKFVHPMMKSLP